MACMYMSSTSKNEKNEKQKMNSYGQTSAVKLPFDTFRIKCHFYFENKK